MIKIYKIDNEREIASCNSCHKYKDVDLFNLEVRFNNVNGQIVTLCKTCLAELGMQATMVYHETLGIKTK